MTTLKQTSLHRLYAAHGAKTVEFGGWDMPVQFSSILQEHDAVRQNAGLFDVSHMGEFEVSGDLSTEFLNYLVTNDVTKIEPGMAMYSPMTDELGGTIDDLLIYCFSPTKYFVVVNAGNIDNDYKWMLEHSGSFGVNLTNRSDDIALLALQGPSALEILETVTSVKVSDLKYYRFLETEVAEVKGIVSRTGYTGEDGFELYVPQQHAAQLWQSLLEAGRDKQIIPCGLGCRDTLRLEARLPLYGHELRSDITPLEAGLGMFVKLNKGDFIGREALAKQKEVGLTRKVVGIQLAERGIPRADYAVFAEGKEIGFCTSGTLSPTLKIPIALAILEMNYTPVGTPLEVDIRGKRVLAHVVKTPFYKRQT